MKDNPEDRLQEEIRRALSIRDWVTMRTHGNRFQRGFPDLYALHVNAGARWIEVKLPKGSVITKAQMSVFPMIQAGHGVWVMTRCTEPEIGKLHQKPNWPGFCNSPDVSIQGSNSTALMHELTGDNPESLLQNDIMRHMRSDGWTCLPTQGNLFQHGFPDFYAYHPHYGAKWVEIKRREGYKFTAAQRKYFPIIDQAGHHIWILTAVSEIPLLKHPHNWHRFMYT
jgi:hypothetical protein